MMKKDISDNLYQKCLILSSKILINVLHHLSLRTLFPWQHTGFQTSAILKAFLSTIGVKFSYLQMVPDIHDPTSIRLLEKGRKYREQNIIDWKLNKKILVTAIDDYTNNWSKREGYHLSALEEWSETVKLIINNRIKKFQHRNFGPCHKILEDPHIKTYLKEIQSKYVLVPADKAGNNIIFVRKYYYIRTLMEELGINSGTNLILHI